MENFALGHYPHIAHQEALTSIEGGVLGIALGGCFTPVSGPFEAAIPASDLVCNVLVAVWGPPECAVNDAFASFV